MAMHVKDPADRLDHPRYSAGGIGIGIPFLRRNPEPGAPPPPVSANAVRLDGISDHFERAAPGFGADGTAYTWARWVKMEGGDGALQTLKWIGTGSAYGLKIERLASNLVQAQWRTAAGVVIGTVVSTTAITVASGWTHLMLDINGTSAVLRVNFAQENNNTPGTPGDIDLTEKWSIGRSDDAAARNYFNGCMAEEWSVNASLGLGSDAAAEVFYDSTLNAPRFLGTSGQIPHAGVLEYLNNPFGSFHLNKAGPAYTLVGAVEECNGPGLYSGGAPAGPSMDFTDEANSMYVPLISY